MTEQIIKLKSFSLPEGKCVSCPIREGQEVNADLLATAASNTTYVPSLNFFELLILVSLLAPKTDYWALSLREKLQKSMNFQLSWLDKDRLFELNRNLAHWSEDRDESR
jgi:hypothetical protein